MSAEGLEFYARGQQAWERREVDQAAALLEQACVLLPAHGAAHHLLGKAMAALGDAPRAEALQQRSCELDPGLGWNWFALAELQEQRQQWGDAASAYRRALQVMPQEGWILEKARACGQRDLLGGEELAQGLGPQSYRFWCEHLEPRLPSTLVPVQQCWTVLEASRVAEGELPMQGWLLLLGPGAVLRTGALQALEAWLDTEPGEHPLPDLITADEDRLLSDGQRCDPWFKPEVLAESSWSTPWLGSFSAWRMSWLRLQGFGWPPGDPLARCAWIWRALSHRPIHRHLPRVLVHECTEAAPAAPSCHAQAQLLQAYLQSAGEAVQQVHPHPQLSSGFELVWALPSGLRCTAIVPTRDRADLLEQCLASAEQSTAGGAVALDWVVVDNGSTEPAMQDLLHRWGQRLGERFRVIRDPRPFNWSALNNQAAQDSRSDLLLFLNNDIQAGSSGWLEVMAAQAIRPAIGCVGATLLYPDGSLQHAGVVIGLCGGADHAYRHLPPDHGVHRGRSAYLSDWGAVTGACLMVDRELFIQAGGFDPALPVEFNDIDFCLRLGQQGYRHVVDPRAVLVHHECQSRDPEASTTAADARRIMWHRWCGRMRSTAPWWPQSCTSRSTDGRPQAFDQS